MGILNRLTLKHLSMNKRRTIVTIIGITLSTALMVGIGLLVSSFLQAMRDDIIDTSGNYHAYFDEITQSEKEMIDLNINVDYSYSFDTLGFSYIENNNTYKPYLYIVSGSDETLNNLRLVEGRLPENNLEIVLPIHLSNYGADFEIGDELDLDIGARLAYGEETYSNNVSFQTTYDDDRNEVVLEKIVPKMKRKYKVVGFIERSRMEDYSAPGFQAFTTKEKEIKFSRNYVTYKNIAKTYDYTDEICNNLSGNSTCTVHESLLYYYGVSRYDNVNDTIMSLLIIALTLLSVGCIIVIYNSFAISTMERKKSFGLYSSLGATPKQIKYTVFFEALLVGLIGIVLGIIGAFLGIYILLQVLNFLIQDTWNLKLIFIVEPLYVIVPVLFMIAVIYFSAFIPARKSGKVTAIELIRENDEIKIPKKRFKTPKWIFKIFGIEGEIALKNIKRNKRKYRITILSLFISIVMFISFSTYLNYGLSTISLEEKPSFDIAVSIFQNNEKKLKELKNNILSFEGIDSSYFLSYANYSYPFIRYDSSYYNKNYFDYLNSEMFPAMENITVQVAVNVLENEMFQKLQESTGVSRDKGIIFNNVKYVYYDTNSRHAYQTKVFERDLDVLNVCSSNVSGECIDFPVSLISENKKPDYMKNLSLSNDIINLFISEDMANQFKVFPTYHMITILSKDYNDLYDRLSQKYKYNNIVSVYSPTVEIESSRNGMLAIKILLYGFIALVTLTGITSVFNTINTSINLRKREFAMLRSMGLTPSGFNKMIFFESLFFGLKSLFYALPVSFAMIILIHNSMISSFNFGKILIPWSAIIIAIVSVFLIILVTMIYSVRKMKRENILETLRDENI